MIRPVFITRSLMIAIYAYLAHTPTALCSAIASAICVMGKPRSNENGPMKRPKVCRMPIAALIMNAQAKITRFVGLKAGARRLLLAVDTGLISFNSMVAADVSRGKGKEFDDR
ncbi:hypothetical protein bAD24_p00415 (plasmid) [Burkholderia sp. AD24]|nr:hypothetical protein bAD24_p00415 [Burkholderia sp. AD24]